MATIRSPDVGELDQRISLLAFRPLRRCGCCRDSEGWEWTEYRKIWAKAAPTGGFAAYTGSGVRGRETEFILRRQSVTLHDAIMWNGKFYLPTAIVPLGRGYLTVKAALVTLRPCKGEERETGRQIRFDAVCVEKLQEHEQQGPMARNTVRLALVTPAEVKLRLGSLVTVGDDPAPWWVKVCHELEEDRHETEIERIVEP